MDMDCDDFKSTISPADIEDARKFFEKASKLRLLRGISFHDGIIPENPVKFKSIPLKVVDATYDDLEEIEVVKLKNGKYYFLNQIFTDKSYVLMDVKESLEKGEKIDKIKGVTPEIRVAFTFHWMEKEQERIRKELLEPENAIKKIMQESGAIVEYVNKNNRGFEVQWRFNNQVINTQMDNKYRISEAGFCVSNWDGTQSARSLVNVLDDYINDGDSIHKTRTVK